MTLRRRLLLAVLPLGLLLLLLGGAGAVLLHNLGRRSDAILHENYDSIRAMILLAGAADRMERAAVGGDRAEFLTARAELLEQLATENRNITVMPDEPRLAAELTAAVTAFAAAGDANPPRLADLKRLLPTVKAAANAVLELNQDEMHRANQAAQATAARSVIGFGVGFAVAVLVAVAVSYRVVAAVVGPIRDLTGAVRAVRGGDLTHRLADGRRDEFGELASAFNDMAEQLWLIKQTNYRTLVRTREAARATIDSFPSPVLVIDPEGRVELANPAARRLFGLTAPTAVWSPPDALRQPLADALRDQRAYLTDTFDQALTLRADGGERVYLPQVRPIRGDRGDTLGAAVVLDDVTQFRLLDQLKGDFVATVGHELKTPLTGLRMAVHLLLEEAVGPLAPKQTELLLDARDNAERLFALIEQLLALARLEDRREYLSVEACSADDLFRRAADAVAVRAADKSVAVVAADAAGVPPVVADPVRFGHALDNLLTNAVTYTPAGGTITLSATADGDRVRLTVADTGVGIPADQLPHVFEKFFRVPGDGHPPGTGLGLAIVREIVAAHGGDITCESAVGLGTTFRITLPGLEGGTGMTATTDRPRPEQFLALIREQKLGRLKVYLGFAPGVGKTYEMLQEGQRLKRQGVDVVIGVIETHGRPDTVAQVGDLEQVSRRRVEYRGVGLDEMDLDAVLARRPAVVLVDELAHTNAPGSRFAKRYQDVEELLRNGIHVIAAMNVQHLESLCDVIERFAGVRVKERVPDYVLGQAHQIVNVDLPAEDLQERLAAGKIYPQDRVERALEHFFTGPNLSRLRELALEEVAHLLDRQREKAGDTATTGSERVAVLVSSRSPTATRLLRKTARVADRLRAPWFAVYVQTPSERAERVDAETQRRVADTLTLARQLGGVPVELKGDDFATAVADYVRQHAITHVVVGRSGRAGWRRWFSPSPLDRLLAAVPTTDVLVSGG